MRTEHFHEPVLLDAVVSLLEPKEGETILDGTVGGGGHAAALLDRIRGNGTLIGLDRDPQALDAARQRLAAYGSAVLLLQANFRDAERVLAERVQPLVLHRLLLDLGISRITLERSRRGFSFEREDEPLDMRMDPAAALTAADLCNSARLEDLATILEKYGEDPLSSRIAHAIVARRQRAPFRTVGDLVGVVRDVYRTTYKTRRSRRHPATRVFQALRIAVNDELQALGTALPSLLSVLQPGGRMAIITFQSLEDRIVKNFFRHESRGCICPPELPVCQCGHKPRLRIITKHAVTASEEEQRSNPRSRSAKLRVAEKLP